MIKYALNAQTVKIYIKESQVPHIFLFSKLKLTETFQGVLHHKNIQTFERMQKKKRSFHIFIHFKKKL